jgi:hypothetical protein
MYRWSWLADCIGRPPGQCMSWHNVHSWSCRAWYTAFITFSVAQCPEAVCQRGNWRKFWYKNTTVPWRLHIRCINVVADSRSCQRVHNDWYMYVCFGAHTCMHKHVYANMSVYMFTKTSTCRHEYGHVCIQACTRSQELIRKNSLLLTDCCWSGRSVYILASRQPNPLQ